PLLAPRAPPPPAPLPPHPPLDPLLFGPPRAPPPAPRPPPPPPLPPAAAPPAPERTPPLPPASRACSSRNVRRERRSWTRPPAASTRWRRVLFSCSRSATPFRVSASGLAPDPPRPLLSFSYASAFTARARHPASSSATSRGSPSARSRSTGGCSGSGRYATRPRSPASSRTSKPNNGAAQTGESASRGPAHPTSSPPRCTATQPTSPPVAASTLQSGAAALTANSKWYFRSHMSISGSFAPSDQWGGRRAPVRAPATDVHSSGAPAPVPFRKTVPTSKSRISRF